MKKLVVLIACMVSISLAFGQAADKYQLSMSAKPSTPDNSDLSKLNWTITANGKPVTIDSRGKGVNARIVFKNKVRDTDLISGIEYLPIGSATILSIGFENDDSSYGVFYILDADLSKQPSFVLYSTGFGANQFLSNGENVFEATQFSYHFFSLKTKKDIWNNDKTFANDCHYDNQLHYQGNYIVQIVYAHYIQSLKRATSATISLKDGNEIKK